MVGPGAAFLVFWFVVNCGCVFDFVVLGCAVNWALPLTFCPLAFCPLTFCWPFAWNFGVKVCGRPFFAVNFGATARCVVTCGFTVICGVPRAAANCCWNCARGSLRKAGATARELAITWLLTTVVAPRLRKPLMLTVPPLLTTLMIVVWLRTLGRLTSRT